MSDLTSDKQLALQEVRQALYRRLSNFKLTDQMLEDKSLYQLMCLLMLLIGQYSYCPTFSDTCGALEEIFGKIIFEKPLIAPKTEAEQPEPKPLIN